MFFAGRGPGRGARGGSNHFLFGSNYALIGSKLAFIWLPLHSNLALIKLLFFEQMFFAGRGPGRGARGGPRRSPSGPLAM